MSSLQQNNDPDSSGEGATLNKSADMAAKATDPVRFNNIGKSPKDTREYRGLILKNQMKVLLISDTKTDKSAASLHVNVGYMSDPKEIPGLAHFCEHMLFLGTSKYPEVNDYNQFLSQNGGASNASTYLDHTNYYFDVDPESLEGALDRFSQFFMCPLFTESVTEKEINAVHQEHEKNLSNDSWRMDQLDKSSADPNHPYSKFGSGNRDTLEIIPKQKDIDVRKELLKFYNTWYSSNIMALSVLGKESLDDLERLVIKLFSDIENKNVESPRWTEHPFNSEHFGCKWNMVPIKDVRHLNVTFPIPDLHEHFRAAPVHYWSHLLGHEGKGSLLSALKEKGWSNSLMAGKKSAARGFDFFSVYVDLTEEGLLHVDDIITMIFQYINMLNKEGAVKWIFNEYCDIAQMNFRFREKMSPRDYVNVTVQFLQEYPIEEVLTAPRLYTEWKPDLITSLKEYLVPDKIRVLVIAKKFEKDADSVEPWYGIKYKKERISKEVLHKWRNAGTDPAFQLPLANEFIPTVFDIKPSENVDKYPTIIEDSPFFRLWFKQDDEFLMPKAVLTFDLVCPLAYSDPVNTNMTYLYTQLLKDSLNEFAYNADLAGLSWEIGNSKYGLTFVLSGYDHKLHVLLEKVLDRMVNFTIDEKRFNILKENYERALKNFEADQPYQHSSYYLTVLLAEQYWVKNELLNACSLVSVERLREFVPHLLSKLYIECLFHGNLTKAESLNIIRNTESTLTTKIKNLTPLLPKQMVLFREFKLPDGCHFLYEIENKFHKSSCTQVYYQTGVQSTKNNMLLELLTQIISEPCFNVLRNQEQLGYIVFSGIRRSNGVQGLRIIVQSSRHPQFVEDKIDAFMESMEAYINNMSDEEFNKHKESLALKRLEKPKKLSSLSVMFWYEISCQQYNFDRSNIEVAYLRTITKSQIIDFYKECIGNGSPNKHKLCIHVISTADGVEFGEEKETKSKAVEAIEDVLMFKTNLPLFPLVNPYNNVTRRGTQQQSKL